MKTNPFGRCPVCLCEKIAYLDERKWSCPLCGFTLYHNTAAAVGLIIPVQDKNGVSVLCVKRGREPRKGFYALPGGFVDPDESAENACVRECREETGITPVSLRYVCSAPNTYEYKNIVYKTCDLFFEAQLPSGTEAASLLSGLSAQDADEIKGYRIFPLQKMQDVSAIPLAFPSAACALQTWFGRR